MLGKVWVHEQCLIHLESHIPEAERGFLWVRGLAGELVCGVNVMRAACL